VPIAEAVIAELQAKQDEGHAQAATATYAAQVACREIDAKLSRLTDAYLAQALTLDEYREARERLVAEKQTAKDRIAASEANRASWFEPAIRFVEAAKQAVFLASSGTDAEKREFLRKTGSNLTLRDRVLLFEARGAWKIAVNHGSLAHNDKAALLPSAASSRGESRHHVKRPPQDIVRSLVSEIESFFREHPGWS
jgi:hypothetical protein